MLNRLQRPIPKSYPHSRPRISHHAVLLCSWRQHVDGLESNRWARHRFPSEILRKWLGPGDGYRYRADLCVDRSGTSSSLSSDENSSLSSLEVSSLEDDSSSPASNDSFRSLAREVLVNLLSTGMTRAGGRLKPQGLSWIARFSYRAQRRNHIYHLRGPQCGTTLRPSYLEQLFATASWAAIN